MRLPVTSNRHRAPVLILVVLAAAACAAGSRFSQTEPADACQAVRTRSAPFVHADVDRGARRFETDCAQCHSLSADRNKLPGPHLHDVVSREIGQTSFRYSQAFRNRTDRWTLAALDQYIADPAWFIPETRMNYPGLNDPSERLDLIAFLSCSALAPAPAPREQSVRPGANENFLADDLDVGRYVGIFEGESRELNVHRAAIVEALGLGPDASVADIGAGTGLFLPDFNRAAGSRGRVYAVDISPKFLAHLRERVKREGLERVQVVTGLEDSVELPDASVDLAFISDTYHHFEYPKSTLASLHAAIRPGGFLVIVDFERIPGKTRDWLLEHVRAGKQVFTAEVVAAGFEWVEEVEVDGLEENYMLRFRRP